MLRSPDRHDLITARAQQRVVRTARLGQGNTRDWRASHFRVRFVPIPEWTNERTGPTQGPLTEFRPLTEFQI